MIIFQKLLGEDNVKKIFIMVYVHSQNIIWLSNKMNFPETILLTAHLQSKGFIVHFHPSL